jgi:DNA-binding response OmpR family regulator
MPAEPGRLTRASIHSQAGDVELRLSLAGNWVLAIRCEGDREWHVACSGDLSGGAASLAAPAERDALRCGALVIDTEAHKALVGGEEVRLSRLEYGLLATLATQPCRVFGKRELMQTVWGYDGIATRTLDSHASKLRMKLRRAGAAGFILNTKQVGYRLWDGVG